MKKQLIFQKILTVALMILPFFTAMANDDPFDDDVDDLPPVAPIDDYVGLMLVVAIYLAFQFFKQKQITKSVQ